MLSGWRLSGNRISDKTYFHSHGESNLLHLSASPCQNQSSSWDAMFVTTFIKSAPW